MAQITADATSGSPVDCAADKSGAKEQADVQLLARKGEFEELSLVLCELTDKATPWVIRSNFSNHDFSKILPSMRGALRRPIFLTLAPFLGASFS